MKRRTDEFTAVQAMLDPVSPRDGRELSSRFQEFAMG